MPGGELFAYAVSGALAFLAADGPGVAEGKAVSPAPADASVTTPTETSPSPNDTLEGAGYLPGYRAYQGFELSPHSPRAGSLAGGMTPGYAAPMPLSQWTFRFSGFMQAALQTSMNTRPNPEDGQSSTVFHASPTVVDEYASFVGTSTAPGQYVSLKFAYGNGTVTARVQLSTWNPSEPTTYYQIGSQNFINYAYLDFKLPQVKELQLNLKVGYFQNNYGNLGEYTPGMYTNPITGYIRGVGESLTVEYQLNPTYKLSVEHGFAANRNGWTPRGIVPTNSNGNSNPVLPSAWIHHAHVSLASTGPLRWDLRLHYLTNWAQDERGQVARDNPVTRSIDESYIKDGRIDVVGADLTLREKAIGYLAVGGAYVKAKDAFPLRGLDTFGGEGEDLTERWFGHASSGTGSLWVLGLNWTTSLYALLDRPTSSSGLDVFLSLGAIVAKTSTETQTISGTTVPGPLPAEADTFNGRLRHKQGLEGLVRLKTWLGVGLRADRVAPNSKDASETFYVLSPRVEFRTRWISHEKVVLTYGKWFLGRGTHAEEGSLVQGDLGLDDQLLAMHISMWW